MIYLLTTPPSASLPYANPLDLPRARYRVLSCQPPQRRFVPLPDLDDVTPKREPRECRPDPMSDGEAEPPVLDIPSLDADDVSGKLSGVQGLRRGSEGIPARLEDL